MIIIVSEETKRRKKEEKAMIKKILKMNVKLEDGRNELIFFPVVVEGNDPDKGAAVMMGDKHDPRIKHVKKSYMIN